MKQTLLTLSLLGSLAAPLSASVAPASARRTVQDFDRLTNVTARVIDGSIQADVRRVHTILDPITKQERFFETAYGVNMEVLEGKHCDSAQRVAKKEPGACYRVTKRVR